MIHNTLRTAEQKLCSVIREQQLLYFKEKREAEKRNRMEQIREWQHT